MRPATIKVQFSSGGVIFRRSGSQIDVALIAVKEGRIWTLPKGLVDRGEKPEETAVREVKEETGLNGRITGKIGDVSYWYFIKSENAKCKKTVSYYLLEFTSGSTEDHDYEVEHSEWFPLDEAYDKVTYRGDKEILAKARDMIPEHEKENS
jgi:8-oxo-dGTP diphosphatase